VQSGKIKCENFRAMEKNTLRGFADLVLPSGLKIIGATLHEKNGSRWVGMPGRPYTKEDGKQSWANIIDFVDRPTKDRFTAQALEAIDEFLG